VTGTGVKVIGGRIAAPPPEEDFPIGRVGGQLIGNGVKANGIGLSRDEDQIDILAGGPADGGKEKTDSQHAQYVHCGLLLRGLAGGRAVAPIAVAQPSAKYLDLCSVIDGGKCSVFGRRGQPVLP
jgi:hypothetical protein